MQGPYIIPLLIERQPITPIYTITLKFISTFRLQDLVFKCQYKRFFQNIRQFGYRRFHSLNGIFLRYNLALYLQRFSIYTLHVHCFYILTSEIDLLPLIPAEVSLITNMFIKKSFPGVLTLLIVPVSNSTEISAYKNQDNQLNRPFYGD